MILTDVEKFFQGKSYCEISATSGAPRNTVRRYGNGSQKIHLNSLERMVKPYGLEVEVRLVPRIQLCNDKTHETSEKQSESLSEQSYEDKISQLTFEHIPVKPDSHSMLLSTPALRQDTKPSLAKQC